MEVDLKVKILFDRQALVVYLRDEITLDFFLAKIREACKLYLNQPLTVKWIDNEDDPCTISSDLELLEAIKLTFEYKDVELKVHAFPSIPPAPGAPCPGEDKNVYRRNAGRFKKKYYHVNGHTFMAKRLKSTQCSLCQDSIWGLGRSGCKCLDCGMLLDVVRMLKLYKQSTKKQNIFMLLKLLKKLYVQMKKILTGYKRKNLCLKQLQIILFWWDYIRVFRLFFVIEFIPGGDLMFHMQNQQRLAEEHARFYSAEIILALHFLHSRGIIYRDLKLDNVLLDAEGHIKLTDFGMCKLDCGPTDLTSTFCGTPNYIAPEILRSDEYGFSVDFWALGVLMFEMMAGRSPFHVVQGAADNTEDYLFQTILEGQIRIPRHLSVRAANILKGFLDKDPKTRLGCKPDIEEGLNDIKSHNFFRDLNWEELLNKEIKPPWNPEITNDRDLQRFDTSFTNEEPTLTPDDPSVINKIDQSEFDGFEYINPLIMSHEDSV